jgi:hypothetical protein
VQHATPARNTAFVVNVHQPAATNAQKERKRKPKKLMIIMIISKKERGEEGGCLRERSGGRPAARVLNTPPM